MQKQSLDTEDLFSSSCSVPVPCAFPLNGTEPRDFYSWNSTSQRFSSLLNESLAKDGLELLTVHTDRDGRHFTTVIDLMAFLVAMVI